MSALFLRDRDLSQFRFLEKDGEIAPVIGIMRREVRDYVVATRLQSLVVGISGGVDSAFAVALLHPVCQELGIPLCGRSITIETNKEDEIRRSQAVGAAFCDDFQYLDYTELYMHFQSLMPSLDDTMLSKLRKGNAKARTRMMALYDLAQQRKGMVISTDNFTEYLTGFWTLHGDVGDYAPFINLWKTEVYAACRFLCRSLPPKEREALQSCIDAVPTDGLGISSSDLEQLGVPSYAEVDRIFWEYFNGNRSLESNVLIQRYLSSSYKRNNPVCIGRGVLLGLQ
ncbi:MAG: NAD(+) synthase [Bacteroidales bacterium]|nr:NAD(+) synthase [Bacteroidales bacterium]